MVRLDVVANMKPRVGPLTVNHYGQLPSVTISFDTGLTYSLGQATEALKNMARNLLPQTIIYKLGGTAEAFETSMRSLLVLLIVAIIVIYMILAVLYESFWHPLTILAGLPSAAFGGLLTLWLFNMNLDLYGFVGLFMLIGIVKKNAIMVVDFALEAENTGKTPVEAAVEGSLVRFRPIMMTTSSCNSRHGSHCLGLWRRWRFSSATWVISCRWTYFIPSSHFVFNTGCLFIFRRITTQIKK